MEDYPHYRKTVAFGTCAKSLVDVHSGEYLASPPPTFGYNGQGEGEEWNYVGLIELVECAAKRRDSN